MASKEDKLLAALKSLSPPKGGGQPRGPEVEPPEERSERPRPAARRTIELSTEEIGGFFLAAVVLVVLAFLMGWYGRGVALPGAAPLKGGGGSAPEELRPRLSMDGGAARDLGVRPSGVRPWTASRVVYTILAARFPASGASDAEDYRAFLEEHAFVPAFLRPTRTGTELCVGRFASQSDPVLIEWLPRVRRLHGAFAKALIAQIPERRAPDDGRVPEGDGASPGDVRLPFGPGERARSDRALSALD